MAHHRRFRGTASLSSRGYRITITRAAQDAAAPMLPEPHTPTAADAFGHDSVRSPTVNRLQVSRRRGSEDTVTLQFKESTSFLCVGTGGEHGLAVERV